MARASLVQPSPGMPSARQQTGPAQAQRLARARRMQVITWSKPARIRWLPARHADRAGAGTPALTPSSGQTHLTPSNRLT